MRLKTTSFIIFLLFYQALLPCSAFADGISGSIELSYSNVVSKTEDASGESTKAKTDTFLERYNLNFEKTIYPYLKFKAGGIFEKNISESKTNDTYTDYTLTKINPMAELTLQNPFYTAGVSYNRTEEEQKSSGSPSATNVREYYKAIFGLRPEGFPYMDMQASRTNTFDKERVSQDSVTDYLFLNLGYRDIKNLDIRYQGSYNDIKNKLTDLDVQNISHAGIATYSARFFKDRVSLYTNYRITYQETKTSTEGTGDILFQVFPFSGLSGVDDTPLEGALDSNSGLIDGNLTASSGVNIGPPPIGGDTKPRNIGLDFFNATEVNTIFVWVDRQLPSTIANSFLWEIYTSSDNLNWALLQTVSPASFGTFDNRFEINFSKVTARYIKVVTKPLSLTVVVPIGVDVSNIFVTEIQAFLKRPAEEARGKVTRMSQIYDLNVRTILLQNPSLFYDFYYYYTTTDSPSQTRYLMSNGISINHTFNSVFSAGVRVAREDGKETNGRLSAYSYNASIRATPLRTLSHSLVFSGRIEDIGSESTDTKSIFLYNNAELYKGVNVNLSGGLSILTAETGRKTENVLMNLGTSLVPHRALTIDLNYSDTTTNQSGGGKEDTSTFTRRGEISFTYTPFRTVYIFTSVGIISEKDKDTNFIQNYAATWSPFQNGALQFNFSYNESLNSEDNGKDRRFTPSIRWNVSRGAYLDISYTISKSTSASQALDMKTFYTTFKMLI